LRYPASEEIGELLEKLGLNRLAAEAGIEIDSNAIRMDGSGMRALEQLGAELLILKMQQSKQALSDMLESKIVRRSRKSAIELSGGAPTECSLTADLEVLGCPEH
jgi:hypothetical protein